ncbi:hypothetical protein AMR72_02290 [Flavobacterium psychrophilum]|nr:hypothetical protein AMR72_02290 [Flavobacterium psychrophilum]AOE51453.1 hypothetical protein ALW18_02290 [Flavobacterium psychrophilum]
MTKKLTVLLGAGFSANAGMPVASTIASYFNRDLKEKLLCFSSSEWMWADNKDDASLNNGRLNFDWLPYSYVLNELVKQYINEREELNNYEDFYQYVIDISKDKNLLTEVFEKGKAELLIDKPHLNDQLEGYNDYYDSYIFAFTKKQYQKLTDIINYLIADILNIQISDETIFETYSDFIEYLKRFDEIDIFTLNHDILLERLLRMSGMEYSRGFNKNNSPIHANGKSIEFYNGNFDKKIRIYKLHGSLDLYRFDHHTQNVNVYQRTGAYDYFLTTNYYDKHRVERVNPETGEVLQEYNFDIVPKFITGTNKTEIISADNMYKQLFDIYEQTIAKTENLLVSGYSFCDEHINTSLKKNENLTFINHRRSKDYPFSDNGKNITYFEELL